MDLVRLQSDSKHRLPFYLAMEEYLARNYNDREFFFMWQVDPTVIVGRNQMIEKEVNVEYCRDNNVDICRRKSGGGAVVADMNNIMFSYITSSDDVATTFSHYTSSVVRALRLLGLDASDTSRNDVLIADRKVSGNSYYHIPGRSIVHGTMLYDFDVDRMTNALCPSTKKLSSHGVASTRSRVTTIREHLPNLSIEEFKRHIIDTMIDGETLILDDEAIKEIQHIESEYYASQWLAGKNPKGSVNVSERIDGVGEIAVSLSVNRGKITSLTINGDFLETTDAEAEISGILQGVDYDRDAVRSALESLQLGRIIPGLTVEAFVNILF